MINLATIPARDLSAVVIARSNILHLAEELGFGTMEATRLAAMASDLTRKLCEVGDEGRLVIGIEERKGTASLKLVFQGAGLPSDPRLARQLFNEVEFARGTAGERQLCTTRYLSNPEFRPSDAVIERLRRKLMLQSKTELTRAVEEKNLELEALNGRLLLSLTDLVEKNADAILVIANDGRVAFANSAANQFFGKSLDVMTDLGLVLPDTDAEKEIEFVRPGSEELRYGAIRCAPVIWRGVMGSLVTIRDISERKRAEKHMRVVMGELSHRTKNQLAVIMAMVRMTASSTNDAGTMQTELIQRLQSLSASHDLLVSSDWEGASLEELIRAVLQPFVGSSRNLVEYSGPDVTVNVVAIQNLGLALHELATNAAKYGALSTPDGRVGITWSFEPDGNGENRLNLEWTETNGPPVTPPTVKGFGHVVIEEVASQALNAAVEYAFPMEGVRWSMSIPGDFVVRSRDDHQRLNRACA
jgi:two-component sensor histidine kinase/PAS domain-containing protein